LRCRFFWNFDGGFAGFGVSVALFVGYSLYIARNFGIA